MCVACADDVRRVDVVAQSVACVAPLVVSDRPAVGAAAASATGLAGLDLAGPEALLAR